ncbi:hypothetical protein NQZ68_033575, partial [Dissostichus eleginoides]
MACNRVPKSCGWSDAAPGSIQQEAKQPAVQRRDALLSRLLASSSVCSLTCFSAPALNQPVTIKDKGARFPLLGHLYPEGLAVNPGGGPARRDEGDTEEPEAQEPDSGRLDVGQFGSAHLSCSL